MSERTIPLIDHRTRSHMPTLPARPLALPAGGPLLDARGRPLRDLRISVTDRCNFRCSYCMPKEVFDSHYRYLPHASLLSFEEITRLARVFVGLGVRKLRLTGGEPLLRKDIERLVGMLAELRTPDGEPLDLTLTTNGSLLVRKAAALKAAGLQRVTVSLDALDDAIFRRMNDVDFPVADVLAGIDEAMRAGLGPVKVNMVVKRGTNVDQIVPMAEHFRRVHDGRIVLRCIEYMDVGATNGWQLDEVVPSAEVLERLRALGGIEPVDPTAPGETAERWRWADGRGEIGLISSVTQAFCHECNRARLSTEGQLYLCLFANRGHDLRALLRGDDPATGRPIDDAQLAGAVAEIWQRRQDRYSELRTQPQAAASVEPDAPRRIEMHYIGG